ncbi:TlpA disulfide reductase family protein [Massilia sp. S19_KUP03_FR1]|uniref:TlpA disulfide reductase family protein n=1 Tax=Massilia sp. S19_KUP03_FR1 TaxID=3025503 RepID=UPI002FCD9A44
MISKLIGLLVIGLALLLAAPLHAAWQNAVNGRMLGKRMPPLALQADQSNAVVLVEFWAPWCTPCRESVPLLNRLQHDYRPRGLRVIGMAREPPAELAEFARRVPLEYPVGCDPGGALFAKLGLRSVPYAVLVDRNGIIVWQGNPASLRRETIEATLAAPAAGALMRF